jgi:asparagine synthase (glutamine-hydrolysing)
MCGIAGFAQLALGDDDAARLLGAMTTALAHRGPDGHGRYWRGGVGLAHTRLAIVDVARGLQPMHVDDATIVQRRGLQRAGAAGGARGRRRALRHHSDTEVVLRCARDPDGFEAGLVGMWALAIHDRRRQRWCVARSVRIKPLFVAAAGRGLVFGSELGAVRAAAGHLPDALAIDSDAAHAMLAWGYVPEDRTIYRGVTRLPPGARLELDLATGAATTTVYYRPHADPAAARVRTIDEAADLIAPLLARAGKEHLESDVPVAAFLSGGIDSSLVLAAVADASDRPVRAFTIGFADPRFDESAHARAVAARLGIGSRSRCSTSRVPGRAARGAVRVRRAVRRLVEPGDLRAGADGGPDPQGRGRRRRRRRDLRRLQEAPHRHLVGRGRSRPGRAGPGRAGAGPAADPHRSHHPARRAVAHRRPPGRGWPATTPPATWR